MRKIIHRLSQGGRLASRGMFVAAIVLVMTITGVVTGVQAHHRTTSNQATANASATRNGNAQRPVSGRDDRGGNDETGYQQCEPQDQRDNDTDEPGSKNNSDANAPGEDREMVSEDQQERANFALDNALRRVHFNRGQRHQDVCRDDTDNEDSGDVGGEEGGD